VLPDVHVGLPDNARVMGCLTKTIRSSPAAGVCCSPAEMLLLLFFSLPASFKGASVDSCFYLLRFSEHVLDVPFNRGPQELRE
jgi:hypothetical protein